MNNTTPSFNHEVCYIQPVNAHDNSLIPVFSDGRTMYSKYNPQKDALIFRTTALSEFYSTGTPHSSCNEQDNTIIKSSIFFLVCGLGNGEHIKELLKAFPLSYVLILERNKETIAFLYSVFNLSEILNDKRIQFCTLDSLSLSISLYYLPSLYSNFIFMPQRAWYDHHSEYKQFIKNEIDKSIQQISADYSVQAHFGKIWMHNFLINMNLFFNKNSKYKSNTVELLNLRLPKDKTAAIIAAGPSLDTTIIDLKEKRDEYYVIATDTAFSICNSYNIIPDAVVTIDAQSISSHHFLHYLSEKTLCVADICTNTSATCVMAANGNKILFSSSNHPMSLLPSIFLHNWTSPFFLKLDSGCGTVTASALDFAKKAGFSKIILLGADFAYLNGKPYAKGTYLDGLYNNSSLRIHTSETQFCSLMYRTTLNNGTTEILQLYKKSVEEILNNNSTTSYNNEKKSVGESFSKFNFQDFFTWYYKELNDLTHNTDNNNVKERILMSVLPLAAWGIKNSYITEEHRLDSILAFSISFLSKYADFTGDFHDETSN